MTRLQHCAYLPQASLLHRQAGGGQRISPPPHQLEVMGWDAHHHNIQCEIYSDLGKNIMSEDILIYLLAYCIHTLIDVNRNKKVRDGLGQTIYIKVFLNRKA